MSDWELLEGDCLEILPTMAAKSAAHVITDPPYSEWCHSKNAKMLAGTDGRGAKDRSLRSKIDFAHIAPAQMRALGMEFGRLSMRWTLAFCDTELASDWISSLVAGGQDHVRIGAWVKRGATPQFSGDRPGIAIESIVIAHAKGRKRWNGGGSHALWSYPLAREDREHTTQKPLPLMLELVELFTDPGDLVLDPFAGSGTTGVACLRMGRRFIGIEKDPAYAAIARERLAAEGQGLTLRDARLGQLPMFGGDA